MRIRGIGTAKRVAGWLRSRLRPGPLILGYHRVARTAWDPQKLCVSPENLAEQLEIMTQLAQPISQEQLSSALGAGRNLKRSFVVTLDDGYEDTLDTAAPVLERYGVPASVFVTTGMIGKTFWWCEIQQLVEESATLPATIDISVGDYRFHWTKASESLRDRARLVQAVGDLFRSLPFALQDDALSQLRAAFDSNASGTSQIKALTAEQIAALADSELFEVGSHMVTHTTLKGLGTGEQRFELQRSKVELEKICGRPVVSCSYPNGKISAETPGIVSEAGYVSGCTSQEELVAPGCNPLLLPRLWVGDWGGDQFSRWLRWWIR